MFYNQFVKLCKGLGLSPAAAARNIGLSNSSTTTWKRGSIPKGETLQKIADYFGVSVDFLLDLTPEESETIQYVEDYVVERTGRNREEVRRSLLDEKILDIPHEIYNHAIKVTDAEVIAKFKNVPDSQLKKYILEDYQLLNRRGRIEAVLRLSELSENYRFKKEKDDEGTLSSNDDAKDP